MRDFGTLRRGGPWALPPRLSCASKSLTRFGVWFWFVLGCGFALCFRSKAKIVCSRSFAFQDPTPVSIILGPLSFLSWFGCFCSPLSFCYFFSRCWGNTNPFVVCVCLSVFSSWKRSSSAIRAPSSTTSSRSPPAPVFSVFLFFFVVFRCWWVSVCHANVWCSSLGI